jgi:hypothetical protein
MAQILYPKNIKKYTGSIFRKKYKTTISYLVRIPVIAVNESYSSYDEAFDRVKELNIEHDLPIKNRIYVKDSYYEIDVGNNHKALVNDDCFDLIDDRVWGFDGQYVVSKSDDGKRIRLHNTVMDHHNFEEYTVDHISRDPLDNRYENLRIVTKQEQQINRGMPKHNTSGVKGILKIEKGGYYYWEARYMNKDGAKIRKIFSINKFGDAEAKQLAIDFLKEQKTLDGTE